MSFSDALNAHMACNRCAGAPLAQTPSLICLYKKLTGKDVRLEEIEEVKRKLEEHQMGS